MTRCVNLHPPSTLTTRIARCCSRKVRQPAIDAPCSQPCLGIQMPGLRSSAPPNATVGMVHRQLDIWIAPAPHLLPWLGGVGTAPVARYHHSSAVYPCRSPVGYFDQFPPTSLSVGCRFGQRTFAGATRMERMRRQQPFRDAIHCSGTPASRRPVYLVLSRSISPRISKRAADERRVRASLRTVTRGMRKRRPPRPGDDCKSNIREDDSPGTRHHP